MLMVYFCFFGLCFSSFSVLFQSYVCFVYVIFKRLKLSFLKYIHTNTLKSDSKRSTNKKEKKFTHTHKIKQHSNGSSSSTSISTNICTKDQTLNTELIFTETDISLSLVDFLVSWFYMSIYIINVYKYVRMVYSIELVYALVWFAATHSYRY